MTEPEPIANDDLADVERVLAGDARAFEGIVRRWQGPLVNMAWRYCRDRGRAEELAQEAFVRAWRGLSGWRREASFSTWLFSRGGKRLPQRAEARSHSDGADGEMRRSRRLPARQQPDAGGAKSQRGGAAGRCWRCPCAIASRWCSITFMRWTWKRRRER